MREFFKPIILLSILALSSCCDLEEFADDQMEEDSIESFNVSQALARYMVEQTEKNRLIKNIIPIVDDGDTLMYVCNFTDGWMVISGDKRTVPVLSAGDKGCIAINGEEMNARFWMDETAGMVSQVRNSDSSDDYEENLNFWNIYYNFRSNS